MCASVLKRHGRFYLTSFFFVTLMVLLAFLPDFDMCSVLSPGESALHSTQTAFNVYCFHIPQKLISRLSMHSQ